MSLFPACLLALAILACSYAVRTTLRRGNEIRCVKLPAPASLPITNEQRARQLLAQHMHLTDEVLFWSGSSSPSARTAPRRTAATTAGTTTTGIGGSRAQGSAGVGPFGMCMYPEKRKTRRIPGVDTEDLDA